jgi:DnaK suppressor protein
MKQYRPSEKEPYMNEQQRDYFRAKLLSWRHDILKEAKETPAASAGRKSKPPGHR